MGSVRTSGSSSGSAAVAKAEPAFDEFQPYYDILVDWEKRLGHEAPFFQRVFASARARRVLDCACGTGHHARLFARWGLEVTGSDLSEAMVKQARHDAAADSAPQGRVEFVVTDFASLPAAFDEPFDAVICTGNSLPMAGTKKRFRRAVEGMFEVLAPGGVAVLHMLNFALIPAGTTVFRDFRVRRVEDREILFLKVFRKRGRKCDLDMVVLEKQGGEWEKTESRGRAWTIEQPELEELLTDAGFVRLQWYGGYEPKPFDPAASRDLIVVGRKAK